MDFMQASVIATGDDLVRVKSHPGRGVKASRAGDDLSVLTQRFRNALKKSVEGIVEAGQVLSEAKSRIEHGKFTDWVDRELRFGASLKAHSPEANLRQAEVLMLLARHDVISNPCHWHALPPSIRTLYELTQIDQRRLLKLIEKGRIHAGTTREEAVAFQPKSKRSSKPEVKLERETATLVDVSILLGGADCVLAHIRRLKRARKNLTIQVFEQAVRWAKPKLAKQKGDA
jgi:hypothetical protein